MALPVYADNLRWAANGIFYSPVFQIALLISSVQQTATSKSPRVQVRWFTRNCTTVPGILGRMGLITGCFC